MKGTERGHFSLTSMGINEVEASLLSSNKAEEVIDNFLSMAIPYLKKFIAKVGGGNQRRFIEEAVSCLAVDARRATILMIWVATIDHFYEYILTNKLADFNGALKKRGDKYSLMIIGTKDDFTDIRELTFIEICRSARIISNDVRKILDEKLGIRNTCAHPSGVEVHPSKVVNFIEDLVENIILKYPI